MRIPLDYYRILGLPIQATAEQLQQSYRDRLLQLPRREYSDAAIAARKALLDEAANTLADPAQRQVYDATYLARTFAGSKPDDPTSLAKPAVPRTEAEDDGHLELSGDSGSPSLDVADEKLGGAFLILLELGEYELVLRLGQVYLSSVTVRLKTRYSEEAGITRNDVILSVALACLELGREQWQQRQYENAAESLQVGLDLLQRENLFVTVRQDIQVDLYKLRPYRILELLALPEDHTSERQQGIHLLREMLRDRHGIDGDGNDQSGLSIDDFLRFIQQLRAYLSSDEQQHLFEEEARRPSAVATYLAVYALIARGFAQRQPALIRRAKSLLARLGTRQDIHLEQAVCTLLLGQTEEAVEALSLSQEEESLIFIQDHSQNSPDLLPGLCLYSERWLQEEVFPHFRDLAQQRVALKDYFADEQVQVYLEELPSESETVAELAVPTPNFSRRRSMANRYSAHHSPERAATSHDDRSHNSPGFTTGALTEPTTWGAATNQVSQPMSNSLSAHFARAEAALHERRAAAESMTPPLANLPIADAVTPQPYFPFPSGRSEEVVVDTGSIPAITPPTIPPMLGQTPLDTGVEPLAERDLPDAVAVETGRGNVRWDRLALVTGGVLLALWLLWVLATAVFNGLSRTFRRGPMLEDEQLQLHLEKPAIAIPTPRLTPTQPANPSLATNKVLTKETAQQVVQAWLSAKTEAMGQNHAIDQLSQILIDPVLSTWVRQAESARKGNWYAQYSHTAPVITSVQVNSANASQANIDAEVKEKAEFYEAGKLDRNSSYDRIFRVRYSVVRQNNQWRIQGITLLSENP